MRNEPRTKLAVQITRLTPIAVVIGWVPRVFESLRLSLNSFVSQRRRDYLLRATREISLARMGNSFSAIYIRIHLRLILFSAEWLTIEKTTRSPAIAGSCWQGADLFESIGC